MTIHFDTRDQAEAHLFNNGWAKLESGRWVSPDKTLKAHILRAHGQIVAVQVWER
jgi:hypothetical protein